MLELDPNLLVAEIHTMSGGGQGMLVCCGKESITTFTRHELV